MLKRVAHQSVPVKYMTGRACVLGILKKNTQIVTHIICYPEWVCMYMCMTVC